MTLRSAASYLMRFDEVRDEPLVEPAAGHPRADAAGILDAGKNNSISEEKRKELYAEAYAEAKLECDAMFESERAEFTEQMNAERSRWATEEGGRLSEEFHHAIRECIDNLQSDIERILEPFVSRNILEHMLTDFMTNMRMAISDKENPAVQLSGPKDLLDIVCAKLGNENVATSINEIGGNEVRARIGSTIVETRMAEWIQQLRGGD